MERFITNTCTFKWCSPPAVETTYIKTVIHFDFDNKIGPNDSFLRTWYLEIFFLQTITTKYRNNCLVLTECESLVFFVDSSVMFFLHTCVYMSYIQLIYFYKYLVIQFSDYYMPFFFRFCIDKNIGKTVTIHSTCINKKTKIC